MKYALYGLIRHAELERKRSYRFSFHVCSFVRSFFFFMVRINGQCVWRLLRFRIPCSPFVPSLPIFVEHKYSSVVVFDLIPQFPFLCLRPADTLHTIQRWTINIATQFVFHLFTRIFFRFDSTAADSVDAPEVIKNIQARDSSSNLGIHKHTSNKHNHSQTNIIQFRNNKLSICEWDII